MNPVMVGTPPLLGRMVAIRTRLGGLWVVGEVGIGCGGWGDDIRSSGLTLTVTPSGTTQLNLSRRIKLAL
jgi:hypothetical protein